MIKAIYPGSFDPITRGHADIIERALGVFDEVLIAVGVNPKKKGWLKPSARFELILAFLEEDFPHHLKSGKISIATYSKLTIDFCKDEGAKVIIRGLRTISDFDQEFTLAINNMDLNSQIETMFMVPKPEYQFVSSSIVREIFHFKQKSTQKHLPPSVYEKLMEIENG